MWLDGTEMAERVDWWKGEKKRNKQTTPRQTKSNKKTRQNTHETVWFEHPLFVLLTSIFVFRLIFSTVPLSLFLFSSSHPQICIDRPATKSGWTGRIICTVVHFFF